MTRGRRRLAAMGAGSEEQAPAGPQAQAPGLLACFIYFEDLFIFIGKVDYRKEERQRGRSSIRWFTPQVAAMPGAEPIQSQEPGTSYQVSHAGAGSQGFGPSSTTFPGHRQGSGWEVGLPGLELAPIWDPGHIQGEDFSH